MRSAGLKGAGHGGSEARASDAPGAYSFQSRSGLAYIDVFIVLASAASITFLLSFMVRKNDPKASGGVAVG